MLDGLLTTQADLAAAERFEARAAYWRVPADPEYAASLAGQRAANLRGLVRARKALDEVSESEVDGERPAKPFPDASDSLTSPTHSNADTGTALDGLRAGVGQGGS